jgi:hypothetical protein
VQIEQVKSILHIPRIVLEIYLQINTVGGMRRAVATQFQFAGFGVVTVLENRIVRGPAADESITAMMLQILGATRRNGVVRMRCAEGWRS